jgi:hypothetical protein
VATKKPPSPIKRALRLLQLGFALGVGVFLLGTPILARLMPVVGEATERLQWPYLSYLLRGLTLQLPALVLAPAIAFAAGLLIEGPGWVLGPIMVASLQGFGVAILTLTLPSDASLDVSHLLLVFLAGAFGAVASARAFEKAQSRVRAKEAAGNLEVEKKAALAGFDFDSPLPPREPAQPGCSDPGAEAANGSTGNPPAAQAAADREGSSAASASTGTGKSS